MHLVVVGAVRERHLVPVALLAARHRNRLLDIPHELTPVLGRPVRDAHHLPHATIATHAHALDDAFLAHVEAPVVAALHRNRQAVAVVLVLLDERRVAQQKIALNDVRPLQQIPRRHEARDVVGLAVHRVLDELDVGILVQQRVEVLAVVAAHDVDLLDARRAHGIKQGVDDPRAPHAHERLGRVQRDGHEPAAKPGRDEHGPPHSVWLQRGQARRRELAVRDPAGLTGLAFLANVSHMPLALLISDFDTQMLVECAAVASIVIFVVNVIGKVVFALVKRALAR